jgi:hypothetical protein
MPSGSARVAACHSWRPYTDLRYALDRTAIVRVAYLMPSCIVADQFEPATMSHAWTKT